MPCRGLFFLLILILSRIWELSKCLLSQWGSDQLTVWTWVSYTVCNVAGISSPSWKGRSESRCQGGCLVLSTTEFFIWKATWKELQWSRCKCETKVQNITHDMRYAYRNSPQHKYFFQAMQFYNICKYITDNFSSCLVVIYILNVKYRLSNVIHASWKINILLLIKWRILQYCPVGQHY